MKEVCVKNCPTCGQIESVELIQTNYPGERFAVCNYNKGGCGTRTASGNSDMVAWTNWNRRDSGQPSFKMVHSPQ